MTVVGPSLTWADAYATAAYVLGLDGLDWVADHDGYDAIRDHVGRHGPLDPRDGPLPRPLTDPVTHGRSDPVHGRTRLATVRGPSRPRSPPNRHLVGPATGSPATFALP